MIRDVMVWLDGGASDEIRLAAVADMARQLDIRVVTGLYLNVLPLPCVIEGTATVSANGLYLTTDPGTGVTHPGWHGVLPPGVKIDPRTGRPCVSSGSQFAQAKT